MTIRTAFSSMRRNRLVAIVGIVFLCILFLREVTLLFFGDHWQIIHATQFVVALVLTGICFSRYMSEVSSIVGWWLAWLFSYATIIAIASSLSDVEFTLWIRHVFYFATSATYFLFFRLAARFPLVLRGVSRTLIILALANAAMGVWGSATGSRFLPDDSSSTRVGTFGFEETTGRSGGFMGENYVGVWLAPALAWGVLRMFASSISLVPAVFAGLSGLGIAVSLSRTSVACGIASLLTVVFVTIYRGIKVGRMLLSWIILVLLIWCGVLVFSDSLQNLSSHTLDLQRERFSLDSSDISSGRFDIWKAAIGAFLQSPLFGKGVDYRMTETDRVCHNAFLEILVYTGIVGFFVFYAPLISLIRRTWRYRRRLKCDKEFAYLLCVAAGAVPAMFTLNCAYEEPIMWVIWGLLAGRIDFLMQYDRTTRQLMPVPPKRQMRPAV